MKGKAKVEKVMHEFKHGTLRSSSGDKVTAPDQAMAIAMSEAGMAKKGKKKSKARNQVGAFGNTGSY